MPPPVKGQKCHPCVRNTVLPIFQEGHGGCEPTASSCAQSRRGPHPFRGRRHLIALAIRSRRPGDMGRYPPSPSFPRSLCLPLLPFNEPERAQPSRVAAESLAADRRGGGPTAVARPRSHAASVQPARLVHAAGQASMACGEGRCKATELAFLASHRTTLCL